MLLKEEVFSTILELFLCKLNFRSVQLKAIADKNFNVATMYGLILERQDHIAEKGVNADYRIFSFTDNYFKCYLSQA